MLEKQVAELLATHLSRFIEDVNAEQLEISLWSGNVVLNNVHLRADVLERITALLHGEGTSIDDAASNSTSFNLGSPGKGPSSPNSEYAGSFGAADPGSASVRMLLAPFTVVKGIVRHLSIQVPWASLESEPIHVQVSGVELVLGPLRARPFNAWEEQEREEAIKQQQLALYEEERQRISREVAAELGTRSSSLSSSDGAAAATSASASKARAALAGENSAGAWFSWFWDFDRISQIAVRNVCLTLRNVCLRYEFDYEGLHPSLAKAFGFFIREIKLTTTNQKFRDTFVSDLRSPICKKIVVSDMVMSTHATRKATNSSDNGGPAPINTRETSLPRSSSLAKMRDSDDPLSPLLTAAESVQSAPLPTTPTHTPSAYDTYAEQWEHSIDTVRFEHLELLLKVLPPKCVSLNPIIENAPALPGSSTELTINAASGVQVNVCFGVLQTLEAMWRSYHQSLSCARYRKRLHLLRVTRRHLRSSELPPESSGGGVAGGESGVDVSGSSMPLDLGSSRQLARQRWRFALRCVLDDIQQRQQQQPAAAFSQHDRNHREVVEGMVKFCQLRRTYCQYWKRAQGVPWAPSLDALEEKKLLLMERQLSLTQVLFLRCLSYAEMLQEQDGYARQQAFIEEARLRKQREARAKSGKAPSKEGKGPGGLWSWFKTAQTGSENEEKPAEDFKEAPSSVGVYEKASLEVAGATVAYVVPSSRDGLSLSDLVAVEWELAQRYASPHRAPLAQPTVPQNILPEATERNPFYFTLRCMLESLAVRVDPTYWPLSREGCSVPPLPPQTPLRHIRQHLCAHLRSLEVFLTTVPDERPDKAAWSFFVGSARVSFEGQLRSVLLQSKEDAGDDFIIVKQNACRTHVGVWVGPQLVLCQPLHEWQWWGAEVAALLEWAATLQRTFYAPSSNSAVISVPLRLDNVDDHDETPFGTYSASRAAKTSSSSSFSTPNPHRSSHAAPTRPTQASPSPHEVRAADVRAEAAAPLVWNVTIWAMDICVPLFARDIDDDDLEIVEHQPSGLSSLVMVDSVATAQPQRNNSLDADPRMFSLTGDTVVRAREGEEAAAAGATSRGKGMLHAFLYGDGAHGAPGGIFKEGDAADDDHEYSDSFLPSVAGSFASAKPERCFLNDDACLVLSISTTRLCTVPMSKRRHQSAGREYYLCIGDHDKAVRLFCQRGLAQSSLTSSHQLELMSFVAGEVLVNGDELSIVFNKGIDFIVEPDAFAVLNDELLKPAVFTATDVDSQRVQVLTRELIAAEVVSLRDGREEESLSAHAVAATAAETRHCVRTSWRLVEPGCLELDTGSEEVGLHSGRVVTRRFPASCMRHILAAVMTASKSAAQGLTANGSTGSAADADEEDALVAGGRTIALGVSVARLLVRSTENEDLAEMVLVAPEEVPAATAPYRDALSALGAAEPRAIELVWQPCWPRNESSGGAERQAINRRQLPTDSFHSNKAGERHPVGGSLLVLSVPDITMSTAAGQKLFTAEQLTVVHSSVATQQTPEADVTVSVEAVKAYFDIVLMDLVEVGVGVMGALRPMPLHSLMPSELAREVSRCEAPQSPTTTSTISLTSASLPTLDVRVRSIYLQAPLTRTDVEGTPYVEVNAHIDSFALTLASSRPPVPQATAASSQRIHMEFVVSDAVQLVDYVGGDPEVRSLVTALPWATQAKGGDGGSGVGGVFRPMRCDIDVETTGAARGTTEAADDATLKAPSAYTGSTRSCNIAVRGGALHVYFPFLYLYVSVLTKDERMRRLTRLSQSPLLIRGFTFVSQEQLLNERESQPVTASNSPTQPRETPTSTVDAASPFELTVNISDLDVFLATDAAVPIDLCEPDTVCVVRLTAVKAGIMQTTPSGDGDRASIASAARLRTRAYLDTVSLSLLDLVSGEAGNVLLPNLKVRTEAEVVLVPKETLTGFTYQRGGRGDTTVLVGVHAPHDKDAKGDSHAAAPVSLSLNAYQCQMLIHFFSRNVLQPAIAQVREGGAGSVYEEAAHSISSRRKHATRSRRRHVASVDDVAALDTDDASPGSALTLLVTLPPSSVVLSGAAASGTGVCSFYEFALRRGAQFYSASGGRWVRSPVKNGQLSGLELKAWEGTAAAGDVPAVPVVLFAADLVGVALVESKAASKSSSPTRTADDEGAAPASQADAPFVRVMAALRNTTVRVPHVRWWLRLYALCTNPAVAAGSGGSRRGSAARSSSLAPVSLQESSICSAAVLLPQRRRDPESSRQSSVMFGPRNAARGGYHRAGECGEWDGNGRPASSTAAAQTSSSSSRGIYGSVEITNTQFSFGEGGAAAAEQVPWCRVIVPEARITASPVTLVRETGEGRVYDEFAMDLPQCPQVLLRATNPTAADGDAAGARFVYVSVLKTQPTPCSLPAMGAAASESAAAATVSSPTSASCLHVEVIRSPHAKLISSLRYGRSYHMTDLTLHRTCAVQVQVNALMLHVPAAELFGCAQELLRQSAQVRALFASDRDASPLPVASASASTAAELPSRTYTGVEAQLTNVGFVISSEPATTAVTGSGGAASTHAHVEEAAVELPWCGVTATSISVVTDVALENVLTSTGEPATLMDDALAVGWRMRVWHRVSTATIAGVTVAGHCDVGARWKAPPARVVASQPLPRTVLCVRANRETPHQDDGESGGDSDPPSLVLRQRSTTDFFHVEPTAAYVCSELNNHLLTRVRFEVGDEGMTVEESQKETPGDRQSSIEVPIQTAYTLSRSVLHLLQLWKCAEAEQSQAEETAAHDSFSSTPIPSVASSKLKPLLSPEPVMWYEVSLSFCGHRLRLVSDSPSGATAERDAAHRSVVVEVGVEGEVTYRLDRQLIGDGFDYSPNCFDSESEPRESIGGANAGVEEQHSLRLGTVRVSDGAGNLILLLSAEKNASVGAQPCALVAEYSPGDRFLSVNADHLLVPASPVTAAFVVAWVRAAEAWAQLWSSASAAARQGEDTGAEAEEKKEEKAMRPVEVKTALRLTAEVRQVEVLLAPAGYVVIKRPRLSNAAAAGDKSQPSAEANASPIRAKEVRCDEVLLYSTSCADCRSVQRQRTPDLLARVTAPLLRHAAAGGDDDDNQRAASTLCRVPRVTLINRDRHSWGLCVLRASAFVGELLALRSASQPRSPRLLSPCPPVDAAAASSQPESASTAESAMRLVVETSELLCFGPEDARACSAPALCVKAEQVEIAAPGGASEGTAMATAQASFSATCRTCDDVAVPTMLTLLDEVKTTVSVRRGPAEVDERSGGNTEVRVEVAEPGVQCHLPPAEALEVVSAALCLVLSQRGGPRESKKTPLTIERQEQDVVSAVAGVEEGVQNPQHEKSLQTWSLSLRVPQLRCACVDKNSSICSFKPSRHLAALVVRNIAGHVQTSSVGQHPYIEFHVTEVTGTSEWTEDASLAPSAPAVFLQMRARAAAAKKISSTPNAFERATADSCAFYVQQKSLSLSHDDATNTSGEHRSHHDAVTALTVRVHTIQAHVSLTLLQSLLSELVRPMVRGARAAAAALSEAAVVEMLHATVLHVRQPETPVPPLDELERHAALVRVIDVTSDWTLHHDLDLGSHDGGANVQLHFRNTSPRNVITVRGAAADSADVVTIRLSCCESVNGWQRPAIRVDADVTVKFVQVRVVVAASVADGRSEGGEELLLPDSFVELGERALCSFPPAPPPAAPATRRQPESVNVGGDPRGSKLAASAADEQRRSASSSGASSAWAATSMYSVDAKVGFDASLSSRVRCLTVAGLWQMRYRSEDKRKGREVVRTEREGEATLTLQTCRTEVATLTHLPLSIVAGLRFTKGEQNDRVRLAVKCGTALWRLPLGHAQVLVALVRSVVSAFSGASPGNALTKAAPAVPTQATASTSSPWSPPKPAVSRVRESRKAALSPLDVDVTMPSWSLNLTNDLQGSLAVCSVENLCLQCSTDLQFTDVVVNASTTLYVTDHNRKTAVEVTDTTRRCEEIAEDKVGDARATLTAARKGARVLFAARPSLSLVWTRFSADSRSLSLSIGVEDVVATLPILTALRAYRHARADVDTGLRAFWNESGVEMNVSVADGEAQLAEGGTCCLQAAAPQQATVTTIPATQPILTLTPTLPGEGSNSDQPAQKALSQSVSLDLCQLYNDDDGVHRLRLPGFVSPFGALDLVVRRKVAPDGVEAIHFASTVALSNGFFPCSGGADDTSASAATTLSLRPDGSALPAFHVPPRTTRFVPLPLLQDRFAFGMGPCTFAASAKLVTWAMVADAMTVLADQIATSAAAAGGASASTNSVADSLRKLGVEAETRDGGGRHFVCGQAQVLNSSTITFPVVMRRAPTPSSLAASVDTTASLTDGTRTATADSTHGASPLASTAPATTATNTKTAASADERATFAAGRVVQLTWRRRRTVQPDLLFSGQLPLCEYVVRVEPVWTLWNCTGCRLRLRLRLPPTATLHATAAGEKGSPSRKEAIQEQTGREQGAAGSFIAAAVVENGACFQWMPSCLQELRSNVVAFFQIEAPGVSPPQQWWSAAAPLSLSESPPPFIRLQQSASCTQGAVAVEQHHSNGAAMVVVRCAALLQSDMPRPVYLRDVARRAPLLGTGATGCLPPQHTVPLFFSEYVTTLTPNAKRVGFIVREAPIRGSQLDEREETDAYVLTTPPAATVLSADERDDCTLFYAVSPPSRNEGGAGDVASTTAPAAENAPPCGRDASLWTPSAPPLLRLRPLCFIQNREARRTLFVRPFVRDGDTPVAAMAALAMETAIPPGEAREVLQFCAHAAEPEVHFCYGALNDGEKNSNNDDQRSTAPRHAHAWSPPVRLLSLTTSTLPLLLKHTCAPATSAEDAFTLFPAPRRAQEMPFSVSERCRCVELQSSTEDGRLNVTVRLQAVPPLRVVNRLNTTLQFTQLLTRKRGAGGGAAAGDVAARTSSEAVASTALCSGTSPPWSYLVPPESSSYGCWEVPTLEFQGLRVTLHSNVRRGFSVSVDVDLLQCAGSPSTGLRIGETDAYLYVSIDHLTHRYTVTVVSTRQLERRMLFQPRRLTQVELFVPRCTLYVAAVTLPSSGVFSRTSVVAPSVRGRLRRRDGSVVPLTASDEDALTLLRQLELDVLCVRVVGVYSSVMMTERNLVGSASLGILEVVDCTTPEAVYPVVLRLSSSSSSAGPQGTPPASATQDVVATDVSTSFGGAAASELHDTPAPALLGAAAGVPRFKDPSWCNLEIQLTRCGALSGGTIMVPIQQLRLSVPPVAVHLHDELLFTLRTCFERAQEELTLTPLPPPRRTFSAPLPADLSCTSSAKGAVESSGNLEPNADAGAVTTLRRQRTVYNIFLYELHVSRVSVNVTYTRSADRRYNPFKNLAGFPGHLIPSMEELGIKLKEVTLRNVQLFSATSFGKVMQSFVWPLYRAQLLLQSYKVLGALDALGNPRALLSSWSRGMWDLVTNSSGKSRWSDTREFLRTTTSSTLHSVGALARSIGSLTGGGARGNGDGAAISATTDVPRDGSGGGWSGDAGSRRGVLREVLAEVGGGVADAVRKPLRGAREGGVNGFFVGMASGVVGLVGRPVFGFFRGVGVTSEFYARLLRGQSTLTEAEARRLALERNYRLCADDTTDHVVATTAKAAAPTSLTAPVARVPVVLAGSTFEQLMADIPRWRRSEEKNVRAAVGRVGVHNAALHLPYAAVTAFLTADEFAACLPAALSALLATRLAYALTHVEAVQQVPLGRRDVHSAGNAKDGGEGSAGSETMSLTRLCRECERAAHIKSSLGVSALHKYVAGDVFVRVCTVEEIVGSVTASELQSSYVILLAKSVSAAGDSLFV